MSEIASVLLTPIAKQASLSSACPHAFKGRFSHDTVWLILGGRYPRSVTRLSFRRKKKLSLFGRRTSRVDSKTDLMAEEDTGW